MTDKPATPVALIIVLTEQDIEYMASDVIKWDAELQRQATEDGRFIVADTNEFVVAPLGATAWFFLHYSEVVLTRAWLDGQGSPSIVAIDEAQGDWLVIRP